MNSRRRALLSWLLVLALSAGCARAGKTSTPPSDKVQSKDPAVVERAAAQIVKGFKAPAGYQGKEAVNVTTGETKVASAILRSASNHSLVLVRMQVSLGTMMRMSTALQSQQPVPLGKFTGFRKLANGEVFVTFMCLDADYKVLTTVIASGPEAGFSTEPLETLLAGADLTGVHPLKELPPKPKPKPTATPVPTASPTVTPAPPPDPLSWKPLVSLESSEAVFPAAGPWFCARSPSADWRIFESDTGKPVSAKLQLTGSLSFSGNGRVLAAWTPEKVQFVGLPGRSLRSFQAPPEDPFRRVELGRKGQRSLLVTSSAQLVDIKNGESLARFPKEEAAFLSQDERFVFLKGQARASAGKTLFQFPDTTLFRPMEGPYFGCASAISSDILEIRELSDGKTTKSLAGQTALLAATAERSLTTKGNFWAVWSVPAWRFLAGGPGRYPILASDGRWLACLGKEQGMIEIRAVPKQLMAQEVSGRLLGRVPGEVPLRLFSQAGHRRIWVLSQSGVQLFQSPGK